MYAVIRAGGKQHKVSPGDVIEVERVKADAETLEFTPLLVVDDKGKTRASKADLAKARVTAKVIGEVKGPKLHVYKYRSKTGYRRHAGHRQQYTTIQIGDIKVGTARNTAKKEEATDGT